ncbi:peroxisomal membrane protein 11B-like [Littorina saxatilis]|uniref:Peroxisomal biogenesis factor 11 n=1 Tax=Littorina saxatilis TaxID=31220 RepID=A0AAN9ASA7_9CAEN
MAALPLSKAVIKFNSHSQSRDKLYRTAQYSSKLAAWFLLRATGGGSVLEEKLRILEAALALSRKLFRMGNSLELGQKALDALSMPDVRLRNLAFTAQTLKAVWLLLDHAIWCGKIQLVTIDLPRWSKWSSWAWLIGLTASTAFDLLKLHQLQAKLDKFGVQGDSEGHPHDLADQVKVEMHTMRLNFWRDVCDVFIPLSALQYTGPGLGAFCGLVSSVIGFQLEWEKTIKPFKLRKS